jgi:hypothetical protein
LVVLGVGCRQAWSKMGKVSKNIDSLVTGHDAFPGIPPITSEENTMRAGRIAAALAGAAAISMLPIGPPAMATSLAITNFNCQSSGLHQFECYVYYEGGTAPYTVNWSGSHAIFSDEDANYAYGRCISYVYQVEVVVTDSAGNQVSRDLQFPCS